ncbi:phosphoglycerate dehydrogenase [Clostridium magnum]|uniref:Glyoxylate/hydroxypyruvate reductase B n=1 Tax=Clostridium magnum DSM 2767 TaxID=1121326 RepID=A0A161X3K6_9CLOT|nr:phosphoglycerate dehydrogenase [Clostridium magnum]KZL88366.1 glyoxylate/hydroxypyruvate reductase B [Clostridium magnum DSM 2767]SHI30939.1 Phosphoglycerate dehydrogenase [Clostridium magnum DSM 2767]
MVKVLFTYDYGKENMKKIEDLGYDITLSDEKELSYVEELRDIEVLACYNPFSTFDISKLERLKWIQLSSIGIDQIPKNIVLKNNIIITNNKGGYSIPIGEWIVMDILNLLKRSTYFYKKQNEKHWKMDSKVLELYGKTVTFIGTGTIAVEAAKRLQGFGVKVLGINTKGRNIEYFNKCYSMSNIDKVLSESDVVIITLPYTNDTHHLINEDKFSSMKNNIFFINIARGAIVDEKALINNLQSGKVAAAALDVFEEEPLPESSPLWSMDNVIITPHNSWISELRNERRFDLIYENMKRYMENEELINVTDISKGY